MIVTVNAVEVASELAHHRLVEKYDEGGGEELMYEDPESDEINYTKEAQSRFNEIYDYYFEIITNLSHIK